MIAESCVVGLFLLMLIGVIAAFVNVRRKRKRKPIDEEIDFSQYGI